MKLEIRRALPEDAAPISRIVIAALRRSNSADYPAEVIAQVERNFTPQAVGQRLSTRTVFVASLNGRAVGTASLEGRVVRSVFVDPDCHRQGIGRSLMQAVHAFAANSGVSRLSVPSSITAQGFYEALGYAAVREVCREGERTLVMEVRLGPAEG
ncbi:MULTISPECIES: GNAT family N-acetyltransferase [unclassified Pseudomonas]|uniref:GNAT family N-acetyltransferase n=1 Tax=unclassified Pseudomonas TaxID=196821 RepID=UPI000BC7341E|nr:MULTISPECIES: GNAT family N-acetyltransferase [unclassified Pseudomonas]PVZ15356.1 ribosomal protein S18 acetylase RimI-like enzyme [Pseudomonas sp. URIL14HWK12:I12]PVZ24730.1 ribosomal protein S18 acetylase RimI-like enzyme [Pseudomonas sp. URIL14HWK12:I10]PVZ34575.1 ribosomal protein S18 acetylase RimI-like enzyme [Pseudomonas sp. URIL14HWK12:I11]SNZ08700.1 Acetyltransferase, GNAT family [Pseudomonas sp. URIL14HWK12:I9]